jgi:hypothetical protein
MRRNPSEASLAVEARGRRASHSVGVTGNRTGSAGSRPDIPRRGSHAPAYSAEFHSSVDAFRPSKAGAADLDLGLDLDGDGSVNDTSSRGGGGGAGAGGDGGGVEKHRKISFSVATVSTSGLPGGGIDPESEKEPPCSSSGSLSRLARVASQNISNK